MATMDEVDLNYFMDNYQASDVQWDAEVAYLQESVSAAPEPRRGKGKLVSIGGQKRVIPRKNPTVETQDIVLQQKDTLKLTRRYLMALSSRLDSFDEHFKRVRQELDSTRASVRRFIEQDRADDSDISDEEQLEEEDNPKADV